MSKKSTAKGFARQWLAWWISLQPEGRKAGAKADFFVVLRHDMPEEPDWAPLRKGGPSGLVRVVEGLGLCYRTLGTADGMSVPQWHRWLSDVCWVFTKLLEL